MTAQYNIKGNESRHGTVRIWWLDAKRRLTETTAQRVEIAIKPEDVVLHVTKVDDLGCGFISGWTEDYNGDGACLHPIR